MTNPRVLPVLRVLRKVNVLHVVCDHVVGKDHTHRHRLVAGAVVMATGVGIAHSAVFFPVLESVSFLTDGVGYLIHAFGTVPYIESVVASVGASGE
jgi:hypothetical protein